MKLPLDINGVPIPGLEYTGVRTSLTAGAASSSAAIPTGSAGRWVVVRSQAPVFIRFGTSPTATTDANSILISGNEIVFKVGAADTNVATIRPTTATIDAAVQLELVVFA
jgi:hypothetical protein